MRRLKQIERDYSVRINILILVINLIILCGTIYNTIRVAHEMRVLSGEVAIARISRNLGTSPDWQALREYLKKTLTKGKPRNEALKELDKIGPYVIESNESDNCETLEFQLGLGKRTRYAIWLCYQDDEDKSLKSYLIVSD